MSIAAKVARRFTARGLTLDSSTRRKANAALRRKGFDGNGRFRTKGQAINLAFGVLADFGIEAGEVITADRLGSGVRGIELAWTNPEDSFSPVDIPNSVLHFAWTEMDNGLYEVVAYLS
jgi:hypothetical protein